MTKFHRQGRRQFLQCVATGAGLAWVAGCCPRRRAELEPVQTLAQFGYHIHSGRVTSAQVVAHCLGRIAVMDKVGLSINSIIEVNPDALALARRRDGEMARSPLHGVPVLIKDNIDTADAMLTTAGSLALADAPKPCRDAAVVQRLRAAGVVLLGKTNLSEWANIRSPHSTSGWSARGGLTRNPYDPSRTASGSSSGSAAAVAAGFAPAAIGTETNGSIVSPASACGIVGFKPTVGLVSGAGIIPITHWQDTAGPMTRTCWDAALLMNVMAEPKVGRWEDFTGRMNRAALVGARLGVLRSQCGSHAGVLGVFESAVAHLRAAGARVVEIPSLPNERLIGRLSMIAMLSEMRSDLGAYLAERGGTVRSLADLIEYNRHHRAREMPFFGQEFFEEAERRGDAALAPAAEARAAAREMAGPGGIDAVLAEHRLDALICATNDPAGVIDLSRGDEDVRVASTPAAVAGYPHLTVPMGLADGMPVGLSFIGPAWSDGRLLAYGHAFERAAPRLAGVPAAMALRGPNQGGGESA